jgi:hypothetical protein
MSGLAEVRKLKRRKLESRWPQPSPSKFGLPGAMFTVMLSILFVALPLLALACNARQQQKEPLSDIPEKVRERLLESIKEIEVMRMEFESEVVGAMTVYRFEVEDFDRINYWLDITEQGELISEMEEGQFSLRDGFLHKEETPFWIQSVYTPMAAEPARYPEEFRRSVYALSEVGANTMAFDLIGLSADGSSISAEVVEHLHVVVTDLLEYRISGVCRVFGSYPDEGVEWRRKALLTAAQTLRSEPQLLVWIDGKGAEDLVNDFKELAPELVVAGPGGDLAVAEEPNENSAALTLVQFPEFRPGASHLLLPDHAESLEFLDRKNRLPIESEPWIVDDAALSDQERNDGFKAMFDGLTLTGWTPLRAGEKSFVVRDGVIEWIRRGAGAIQFHRRFSDFVLRFEYKISEGGNSGVHLRSPRANRASRIGFELQLLGDHGKKPSKGGTGSIYSVVAPRENASRPAGEWNSVEVTARGPLVKIVLNEKVVQDVDFDTVPELKDRLRRGFIRLTDHGDYVAFRNIRIKELSS